ncbi:hypothetical protein FNV43_RR26889 [Rhamnella rubrinervis]|uniref:H15 domain-containing protein n=1 Tax=Rhamnella rubrinervis TaxID=2594499 RepID=A0A8K0DQR1_9ROSA|nr:hypothetical protein FNV43_RR26889 [Rhamnella rubrinervis]
MATENSNNPPPNPPPAAPSLPNYQEMIMAAIESVNDPNGCNKSTISKHIESTYGDLPAAHATLLTHHLNNMTQSGLLVLSKNCYMKPDPNAPPKRGRGRPPKPKVSPPPGGEVSSPRPRGRPPKSKDPFAPPPPPKPKKAYSATGRPRGRPPKKAKTTPSTASDTGAPRGRGRPPKVSPVGCS